MSLVTKREMILRLEQLLQRVRTRSAEPRMSARTDAVGAERRAVAEAAVPPVAPRGVAPRVAVVETHEEPDSEERLVAAQSEPPEETTLVVAAPAHDSIPPIEVTEVEVVDAGEEEEEAPISSRRTLASEPEERLADMAFGGEEPREPLHTPPPESGRLPAAPAVDYDADVTGVRSAAPAAARGSEGPELVPEVVRHPVPPSDAVAKIIAGAQRFAPDTFVALLDASLAL